MTDRPPRGQALGEMAAELGVGRDEIVPAALRALAWKYNMFGEKKRKEDPMSDETSDFEKYGMGAQTPEEKAASEQLRRDFEASEPICVGDRNHDDYGLAPEAKPRQLSEERKAALLEGINGLEFSGSDSMLVSPSDRYKDAETIRRAVGKKHQDLMRKTKVEFEERARKFAAETGCEVTMVPNPNVPEDVDDPIPKVRREHAANEPLGDVGWLNRHLERVAAWVRRQVQRAVSPTIVVKFKLVEPGAKLPTKGRETDAGIDFYTNIAQPVYVNPGDGHTFTTGIRSEMPRGYAVLLRDRSGLGSRLLGTTAGVIDSEYRGEWMITIANHGQYQREFLPGDKIAQGIITKVYDVDIRDVDRHPHEDGTLSESDRGEKGFGSSGR